MSTYSRIGVVTGANKGIGLAIMIQEDQGLIEESTLTFLPPDLTARDKSRGEAAVQTLLHDPQLTQAAALKSHGGLADIEFHALDVTDSTSVRALADHLKSAHSGGIDFVINNAGIAMDGFDANVVEKTLECNYYSTLRACRAFIPLLKPSGRIVNVASTSGSLAKYSPAVRARFLSATSESDVSALMRDFQSAVDAGAEKDAGFPSAAYAVSKAGLIGGTRALAREFEGVSVVSCCPGYVNTDMSKGNGTSTPDEGARTPVWLAIGESGGETGGFYKGEKEVAWEDL
ncbi:hypothetical protein HBI72_147630 [Parastagonospora nodorum]|nr:hypothetical protein HBI72_147630 [Parastagonospora nodorum]